MLELSLIVFGVCSLTAFLGGKVGYRMGTEHAATEIVDFFCQKITPSDNDLKSISALLARRSMLTDGALREIANKLHFAAWNQGMADEARLSEPEAEESQVTMKRTQLEDVTWLADYGLRVWTVPGDVPLRCGERLTYEKAEALANILETLERKIAPGLTRETDEEKKRRFTTSLNRMQRVWLAYRKV